MSIRPDAKYIHQYAWQKSQGALYTPTKLKKITFRRGFALVLPEGLHLSCASRPLAMLFDGQVNKIKSLLHRHVDTAPVVCSTLQGSLV